MEMCHFLIEILYVGLIFKVFDFLNNEELEFSKGFTELHTDSYREILKGNGFDLEEVRQSIEIVHDIRNIEVSKIGEKHLFVG